MTSDLWPLILAQTWQLATLVAGVLLVTRVVARDRPHLAHALWLVVLLKCVTPPTWSSPSGVFCWLQPHQSAAAAEATRALAAPAAGFAELAPTSPSDVIVHWTSAERLEAMPAQGAVRAFAWSWSDWLVCVWLAGAASSLLVAAIRWQLFLRRLRRYPLRTDAALSVLAVQLVRRLKVGRRVRLLITQSRIGPAVIGILRPTILLPAAIVAGRSPQDLEPILAHELLHVRRGDLWLAAGQVLAHALWWFHPLVWLANRLLAREAERCCDEQVLAELRCEPARYARSLLEILEQKQELVAVPAFPGVRPVDVTSSRLERIMRLGHGCQRRTPWWCWLVMLLAAVLVLPGAAFVVGAKERTAKPQRGQRKQPATAAREAGERQTRVYPVRDVLARLQTELKLDEADARQTLVGHLIAFSSRLPAAGESEVSRSNSSAPLQFADIQWEGRKLVVAHEPAQHARVAAALNVMREYGFRQVSLRVRMISGPTAMLERFAVKWSAASAAPPQSAKQPSTVSAAFDYRPLPPPEGANGGESWTRATSVVEKNVPVLYSLLDAKQVESLIESVQGDRYSNVLQAPKVTVFNGQAATVMDAVQRPFVVVVKPVAGSQPPAFEPQIRVVTEGTTLRMRPVLTAGEQVRLDYQFTLASIRSVETAKIPQGKGAEPLTVQVPEVASLAFHSSLELPLGQTLAVGALTSQGNQPGAMIVLLDAREVTPDQHAEAAAVKSALNGPIAPLARAVAPAAYLKDDVQYFARPAGPASMARSLDRKIVISSNKQTLKEAMDAIAKAAGVNLWIDSRSLAAEGVTPETIVSVPALQSPVAAKTLLKELLEPLSLDYCIDEEAVRVRSRTDLSRAYTKVYHVADLIVAVPTIVAIGEGKPFAPPPAKGAKADFEPLIELIQTTIAPQSWDERGGSGSVSFFDTNLSLVVSQTQDVHEQIADLLTQLRRLQDQQIVLELRLLNVPENFFERVGVDFDLQTAVEGDIYPAHARLSPQQTKALLNAVSAKLSKPTRVTLMNGQGADLDLPLGERTVNLKVVPLIRADRESVRLNLAIEEEDAARAVQNSQSPNCQTNQTFLLDVTDRVPAAGVPILTKIPHVERLFRQVPPDGSRVLLLVTPTIHIAEEVEAR